VILDHPQQDLLHLILDLSPGNPLAHLVISLPKIRKLFTDRYGWFTSRQAILRLLGDLHDAGLIHCEQARGFPRIYNFHPNRVLIYPTLKGRDYFSPGSSIDEQGEEREVTS